MKKLLLRSILLSCLAALSCFYIYSNANSLFVYAIDNDSVPLAKLAVFFKADVKSILKNEKHEYKYNIYPHRNMIEYLVKSYGKYIYEFHILEKALKDNSFEIVKTLLDNCDIEKYTKYNFFYDAIVSTSDPEILKLFLSREFDLSDVIISKMCKNKFKEVKILLETTNNINFKSKAGITPLMCSIANRDREAFDFLINRGADVNSAYRDGDTPLFMALRNKPDFGMAKTLIDKGAKLDAENALKERPLEILTDKPGNEEIVRYIIEKGVSVDTKNLAYERIKRTGNTSYAGYIGEPAPLKDIPISSSSSAEHSATTKSVEIVNKEAEKNNALLKAIEDGSPEKIKELIEAGADLSYTDSQGNTLLMKALERDNDRLFTILVDCGADVNSRNLAGETALTKMIKNSTHIDVARLRYLLKAGTDINIKDSAGKSAPHYIVGKQVYDESEIEKIHNLFYMHKAPASRELYKKREKAGYNRIMLEDLKKSAFAAAGADNLDSLEIYSCSLFSRADFKELLLTACKNKNIGMMKYLFENFEDVMYNYDDITYFISTAITNKYDREVLSALLKNFICVSENWIILAIMNNNMEGLELLINKISEERKAPPPMANSLMLAIELGNQDAVKLLARKIEDKDLEPVSFHTDCDINVKLNSMQFANPFYRSIMKDQTGITKILVDSLNNINKKFQYGFTPLIYAAWYGRNEIVSAILSRGADPDLGAEDGTTPLMYASMAGNTESVKLLINGGASVNKKNSNGINALCEAITSCRTDVVELLKCKGADYNEAQEMLGRIANVGTNINSKDFFGNSMLAKAAFEKNFSKAKYLLDHGAKVNDFTGLQTTIFGAAIIYFSERVIYSYELVKLLRDKGADPYYMNNESAFSIMFQFAIKLGYENLISDLIACKPSSLDISKMHNLLDATFDTGNIGMAKILLSGGIDPNIKVLRDNETYREPLFFKLVKNNDYKMLELITQRVLHADSRANHCSTVEQRIELQRSALLCNSICYENSYSSSFMLHEMPKYGGNAFFFISSVSRPQGTKSADFINTMDLLIKAGCDINCRNDYGYTPLIIGSMHLNSKAVNAIKLHPGVKTIF